MVVGVAINLVVVDVVDVLVVVYNGATLVLGNDLPVPQIILMAPSPP
jgi:hypothetical protein